MPSREWRIRAAVAALCLAFFLQCFFASRVKSPCGDECVHIGASAQYIDTHTIVANPQHPPLLKELAGISLALAGMHWHEPGTPLEKRARDWDWTAGRQFLL